KIKRPKTLQVNRLFNKSPLPRLLIANITVNIESESNVIPKKSIFSKTGTFVSVKEIYPINNKIMPIGTLIKNNQCHVPVKSIIKLPKPGPITEAISCIQPIIPNMLPCFYFLKLVVLMLIKKYIQKIIR